MSNLCKNCHNILNGHYCSHCGQSADTHRLNFHFLWHDVQHGLLHVDKGILYTVKELFTRPGHTIREFLEGKRVKHFKPISLVLILAGIYGFLSHYFHISILRIHVNGSDGDAAHTRDIVASLSEWVSGHYAWLALLQLPLYTVGTFLAFRRWGYNFAEHFVLNAFLTGQRLILHLVCFPVLYLLNGTSNQSMVSTLIDLAGAGLMLWSLTQFFNQHTKWVVLLRGLLSLAIFLLAYLALGVLIAAVIRAFFW